MSRRRFKKQAASKATRKDASKAVSKAVSKAATIASCHFLRVPIEIRLKIYDYLLLDPPCAALDPNYYDEIFQGPFGGVVKSHRLEDEYMDSDDIYERIRTDDYGDSVEDDMFDFGGFNPYGIAMGDMCDGMFNDVYNNCGTMDFGSDMDFDLDDQRLAMCTAHSDTSSSVPIDDRDESENEGSHGTRLLGKKVVPKGGLERKPKIKRHLAILRTNRQIYNEASALLHSDLTINVSPGDAVTDIPGNAVVKQTQKVWRHAPLKDLAFTNINGQMFYKSLPLDGPVEPHVFARFEKISYYADFKFERDHAAPSLYINDDLSVGPEDAAKFVSYLTTAKSTTRWFEGPIPFKHGPR